MFKKLFFLLSVFLGTLMVTGCSEIGAYSNDFDIVRSDASSVKPVNEPITQNTISLEEILPQTLEPGFKSLISTTEGFVLLWGWEDARYYEYDVSVLTNDEKESFIQQGLKIISKRVDLEEFRDESWLYSEILARYYSLKKDTKKKLYWTFKSAEKGSSLCMRMLSDAYRGGHGVVQDYEEGFKWTYLGAAAGNEWCKKWVKETNEVCIQNQFVFERLSPMLKEAKKRANQWMNEHPEVFISTNGC